MKDKGIKNKIYNNELYDEEKTNFTYHKLPLPKKNSIDENDRESTDPSLRNTRLNNKSSSSYHFQTTCCEYYNMNENEALHPLTNIFNYKNLEERYQMYTYETNFIRARRIMISIIVFHLSLFIAQRYIYDRSLPRGFHIFRIPLRARRNSTLAISQSFIELWFQMLYLPIAILFIFIPKLSNYYKYSKYYIVRYFIYLLQRYWKILAAIMIVIVTVGIQLYTSFHVQQAIQTYQKEITNGLTCNSINNPIMNDQIAYNGDVNKLTGINYLVLVNHMIYVVFAALFIVFLTVNGAIFAMGMQLDFLLVILCTIISCILVWMILISYKITQWHIHLTYNSVKTFFSEMLVNLIVIFPSFLIFLAVYHWDRNARITYLHSISKSHENIILKWNIEKIKKEHYRSVTKAEKEKIEKYLYPPVSKDRNTYGDLSLLEKVKINFQDICLEKMIGFGTTGTIFLGKYIGTKVVIKTLSKEYYTDKLLSGFKKQVEILACLRHPNIVQFIGASYDNYSFICHVMEYLERGDVFSLLHNIKNEYNIVPDKKDIFKVNNNIILTWSDPLLKIAIDAARGVQYLHESSIIHRDLKSSNLLCTTTYSCKVSDFGESKKQKNKMKNKTDHLNMFSQPKTMAGTPYWLAPEVLREEEYDFKSDVYSFGIVLIEMESRRIPYFDMMKHINMFDILLKIANNNLRPTIPSTCSDKRKQLILDCIQSNVSLRPTMTQVLDRLTNEIQIEILQENQAPVMNRNTILKRQKRIKFQPIIQDNLSDK